MKKEVKLKKHNVRVKLGYAKIKSHSTGMKSLYLTYPEDKFERMKRIKDSGAKGLNWEEFIYRKVMEK